MKVAFPRLPLPSVLIKTYPKVSLGVGIDRADVLPKNARFAGTDPYCALAVLK